MNLTEVLDTALPEIPAQRLRDQAFKIHPDLVAREHIEDGVPVVRAIISGKTWCYRFSPVEWQLVQLFDGQRSYGEISAIFQQQTGTQFSQEEIREFASRLDSMEFWYKTPLEQNIALKQRLAEERRNKANKKSKYGDVSNLVFSSWDPDHYLGTIHPKLKFIYSRWFAVASACAVGFMFYIFATHWSEIGNDTLQFYNFREKSFWDIVEFWCLACAVLFVHESAHGLTCKHFGGHVHHMGFNLLYMTPAFFTDCTEILVYGGKWERLATIFWGAWSEMLVCAIATPIWWGTAPGSFAHEWAYKFMLITGVGVLFLNWNPLIKLDGYYLLTEFLGISGLKEDSTAYVGAWVKKHVWRLPVEVPYVPRRRRVGYAIYALSSGLYSYSLLLLFARFAANVANVYSPQWGFLFGIAVGLRLFKSRILTLGRFMHTLYLDKKEWVQSWFTPGRRIVAAVVVGLLLVLPLWRQSTAARFSLEPANRAVVRAAVPGTVVAVYRGEGEQIAAGGMLARLENLPLQSKAARAAADYSVAASRATGAQLQYKDFGPADREREELAEKQRDLNQQVAELSLTSPISGTVATPRLHDLLGSYLNAGDTLAEVADISILKARIYVPEPQLRRVRPGSPVRLQYDSGFGTRDSSVLEIAPVSGIIEPGLIEVTKYKGIQPPGFFMASAIIANPDGQLLPGMKGTAKIYGPRRSLLSVAWDPIWDFVGRKFW